MVYRESFRNLAQVPVERPLASAPVQNNKFGSWVDPTRQAQINQAGLSQEQQNVNQIGQQIAASPEHRYGLMEQYNKEQEKQNQTIRDLQPEMRRLSEQNIRQEADQITRNYGQGGEGANSFGNQYAAAVRGNNSASINMARAGNVVIPAGDALEKFGSIGAPMSQKLKSALADSDYMHQYEYMPGAINASMAGYKGTSMGDGSGGAAPGQTVGGEDQRREGWGSTFMPGGEYDRGGGADAQWKYKHDYDVNGKYVGNQQPTGYRGASPEYLNNIKSWSKQPNNLWVDQTGKLARMNYDPGGSGMIDSVSTRKGDTYTQRDNPDGKYTNWNWIRDQQKNKPVVAQAPATAPKADGDEAPTPTQPTTIAQQPTSLTPPAMTQNEDGTWSGYGGPSGDGKNVHQYGDPRQNTGNNNNYQWQPPFLWPKGSVHDNNEINEGFASQDGNGNRTKARVPTKNDTQNEFRQGVDDWRQFYDDKGYNYTPQNGNGAGWGAGANESRRNMGFGAQAPAAAIAPAPAVKLVPKPMLAGAHPNNDIFSQSLLGGAHPTYEQPAKIYPPLPGMKPTGGDYKPSGMGFEDGQIQQILEGHKAPGDALAPYTPDAPPLPPPPQTPEHRAVVNGYKILKQKNPPLAQFLGRVYTS